MADTIVDGTLFNANNILYTSVKANDKMGKSLNILNKFTRSGLRLSTPLMLTWGASEYVDPEGNGNGKYEMSLQFPQTEYSNPDCEAFFKNVKELEDKIKADALINSKDWFGKVHKSADIIDELFTPMLKYPKIKGTSEPDMSKKPTLRVKIPQWEGIWKTEIYDEDSNALFPNKENSTITPLDFLKKGTMVASVIQCGGIWFTNGKFTVTWKLLQAVVQKPKGSITGQCLIKLKPAEKEQLKAMPAPVEENESVLAHVEDSDEEEVQTPAEPVLQKEVQELVAEVEQDAGPAVVAEEVKPKKKIIRKKTDA
jgi:hypothetical protein